MKKLIAFNGDEELKKRMVEEVKWHQQQDHIIQGTYGDKYNPNGNFCAVGCALNSLNKINGKLLDTDIHLRYEPELGIPEILARLEDGLFEEMSPDDAKLFPLRFIESIPVGADLSMIFTKLVIWEWRDEKSGISKIKEVIEDKELYDCCESVCILYERHLAGEKIKSTEWKLLEDLADRIYRARTRARTGAGAWAWARARTRARTGAGAWAWARARTGAGAWAWAWARARTGADYQKEIMVTANKLLELLADAPIEK